MKGILALYDVGTIRVVYSKMAPVADNETKSSR
jgi:hypothetical protein